jgi:hypothetical protein
MNPRALAPLAVFGLFMGGEFFVSSTVSAADEVYKATLVSPRGIRADKVAELTLTVQRYATQEDADGLDKIYDAEGSDGLIKAIRKMSFGEAKIVGGPTRRINWVRVFEGEGGDRIVIVTDGPLYFPEDEPDFRSRDSLGFIRLDLNKAGKGGGTLAEAVKIDVTEDDVLQIQAYQTTPIQLRDVSREQ